MSRNALLKPLRLIHLYIGVFITPALIFFAFTGALQTFGLHEANRDHPNYKPARWVVVLSQLHKKQTTIVPIRRQPTPGAAQVPDALHISGKPAETRHSSTQPAPDLPASRPADTLPQPTRHPLPLRIFFLVVSLGLFTSSISGLYMTYSYIRNKPLITLTLIAGTVVPLILIFV